MADANSFFAIRAVTADSTSWTPITVPIWCNTWSIRPDAAVKIRTDQADPLTEDIIADGNQISYQVPGMKAYDTASARFVPNTVLAYVQSLSGSVVVHAQFAR